MLLQFLVQSEHKRQKDCEWKDGMQNMVLASGHRTSLQISTQILVQPKVFCA